MSSSYSGPLAAWSNAFFAGLVSLDQVVDAVTGDDAPHTVGELAIEPIALRELIVTWRRAGEPVRMALPVAGDVLGLPGPTTFRAAALEVGETAFAGTLAAVPEVTDYSPSSRPPDVCWRAFTVEPGLPQWHGVADAQYELTEAVRECSTALAAAQVGGSPGGVPSGLGDARRAGERLNLPPGFPPRAVALLGQAERLTAVLDLALADPAGGAIDRMGMAARDSALRPLVTAVRHALVAGYNTAAEPSPTPHPDR